MAAKWIVINNEFRFGNVGLHKELVGSDDKKDVKGGGSFKFSPESKTILLFGQSMDFGSCEDSHLYGVNKWPARLDDFKIRFLDETNSEHLIKFQD